MNLFLFFFSGICTQILYLRDLIESLPVKIVYASCNVFLHSS